MLKTDTMLKCEEHAYLMPEASIIHRNVQWLGTDIHKAATGICLIKCPPARVDLPPTIDIRRVGHNELAEPSFGCMANESRKCAIRSTQPREQVSGERPVAK